MENIRVHENGFFIKFDGYIPRTHFTEILKPIHGGIQAYYEMFFLTVGHFYDIQKVPNPRFGSS